MRYPSKHVGTDRPRWRRPVKWSIGLLLVGSLTGVAFAAHADTVGRTAARGSASAFAFHKPQPPVSRFLTVNSPADPTFTELLGINDRAVAVGYFGSGVDAKHPNKGFVLKPDYDRDDFTAENFPGSTQTQVVGINNQGATVGFFVDAKGGNFGFVRWNGRFVAVANPATMSKPPVNQLLGINNQGIAAGFYKDAAGHAHGYLYWVATHQFAPVVLPVPTDNVVATGVNDRGDIAGYYTIGKVTSAFVLNGRRFTSMSLGAKTNTKALGINNLGQVVGSFLDGRGFTHGFVWRNGNVQQIDDPLGTKGTLVNGIDNRNLIVGFFEDAKGRVHGFVAWLRS